ncbi:pyridoxamine 5'-phosphate oxidase [Flavobacterium sp. ZB4P13]|uniref:pyridoxamine 5'-phosphate oxidase n=1 Tax=Flavobacterium sp. ZB4P13 TaxID=3401728 RepID=UPI003AACD46B
METTPIEIFSKWFDEELKLTKVNIPTACCLSTIGTDHYPNARFVSIKGIVENNFIVTGTITSRKGLEITETNKVALTFWWSETERQVRIQGNATVLNNKLADKYFSERNRDSQIVSIVSNQGQTLNDIETLNKKYQEVQTNFSNQLLTRPENWGGYQIEPIRIEFLEFKPTRFHDRKLYELTNGQWKQTALQP